MIAHDAILEAQPVLREMSLSADSAQGPLPVTL